MQRIVSNHRLALAIAGILVSGGAMADAHIATALAQQLATTAPNQPLEVVVTYRNASGAPTLLQTTALRALGIKAVTLRALPMAGALATPAQIRALAQRADVLSIYPNTHLDYLNQESREITGVARAQANPGDFGRPVPWSGAGVTAMINDSGIDGTHLDLTFGDHVVQNVQALTNLHSIVDVLPTTYVEGLPTTDFSSGHGTHCAGIFGGTGARSGGLYAGVAPGAHIVGYGSGAAIAVLDAVGGFDYALANQYRFGAPIRVISNSWGTSGPFAADDPVNIASYAAYKRGMVVLFAAGNDGPGENTHNPYAQAPWVISVAAGDKQGRLADFSSRGARFESGDFTMADGSHWTYLNQPVITAPGVDVISTRTATGALPPLAAQTDAALIAPQYLPFYTTMSGTSMATPHTAGIVSLLLEANPGLTPAQVKDLLVRTATNIPGYESWETGGGYVNAYAALKEASGRATGYGQTVNARATFNASAVVAPGSSQPFSVDFSPVGPTGEQSFTVGADVAYVNARATVDTNTVALVLIDPDGASYGSAISLPELGSTVAVGAPAKPGTWKITVRGIGSVSGTALDPAHVTNGYAAPGNVSGTIQFTLAGGYTGLADIAGHPARGAIENAVANRLVDGKDDGMFHPDDALTRADLARYLVMGAGIRQSIGENAFVDVPPGSADYPFVQAATARGGALKDRVGSADGVIRSSAKFLPLNVVTRADLAYSLVQSLGQQALAQPYTGDVYVTYKDARLRLDDSADIAWTLRGYVQLALDLGLQHAHFSLTQGPYDAQPTLHATFDPEADVTRADYAIAAGLLADAYNR